MLVVFSHCSFAFGDPPYLNLLHRLPVFRVITHGGNFSVAIFFLTSGYVCSLKPLALALARKTGDANIAVGSGAFRRFFRLYAPATIITTIQWLLCQMGAFNPALSGPGWLSTVSPTMAPDLLTSLKSLLHSWVEIYHGAFD